MLTFKGTLKLLNFVVLNQFSQCIMYEASSFCFVFCVVLFTVLITIYVVSINRTSCYRNHNFSSGIKMLPTKKWNVRIYFKKKKDCKKYLWQKELGWCVEQNYHFKRVWKRIFYVCVLEEGWKYIWNSVGGNMKCQCTHWCIEIFDTFLWSIGSLYIQVILLLGMVICN